MPVSYVQSYCVVLLYRAVQAGGWQLDAFQVEVAQQGQAVRDAAVVGAPMLLLI